MPKKKLLIFFICILLLAVSIAAIFRLRANQLSDQTNETSDQANKTVAYSTSTSLSNHALSKKSKEKKQQIGKSLSVDSWHFWVDEQTEAVLKSALKASGAQGEKLSSEMIAGIRNDLREKIMAAVPKLKKKFPFPPSVVEKPEVKIKIETSAVPRDAPKKHDGPQNVDALMASFDEAYNKSRTYAEALEIDKKYPQAEWLSVLLENGVQVDDYTDYSMYMNARANLATLENEPNRWGSGMKGIPPTDDWETFKQAYIDRQLWEFQQIQAARRINPEVIGGLFTGPGDRTFLPYTANRVYVQRFESGGFFYGESLSEAQRNDILLLGEHPDGYDFVYIDENGAILTEAPPPIPPPTDEQFRNLEEWLNMGENHPEKMQSDKASSDNWQTEKNLELPEAVHRDDNTLKQFGVDNTMSDENLKATREKFLKPQLPRGNRDTITVDRKDLYNDGFSSEEFSMAEEYLNRYGLEEGLQRLRKANPEIAEYVKQQVLRRQNPHEESRKDESAR